MMTARYYKADDQVLSAERKVSPRYSYDTQRTYLYLFDFEFRTVTTITDYGNHNKENTAITPFSQTDADLLEKMRDKLIELGGSPSPLTGEDKEQKRKFTPPKALAGQKPNMNP